MPHSDLPADILYHIFNHTDHRDFIPLIRCSRLFSQICNPLLYRDLHLYTPIQLAKLSRREDITHILGDTKSMFIDNWVLFQEAWQEIKDLFPGTQLEECLVKVWKATPSLRWLQLCRSDLSTEFIYDPRSRLGDESQEWSNLASNPTFLPQLTFLISYGRRQVYNWSDVETPFMFLRYGRPVRLSSTTGDTVMTVNVNYKLLSDASNASLVSSDLERSNWSTYGRLLVEFIDSSLHVSAKMKTSPRTLVVSSYNQDNAFRTQDIYPFLADLLALLGLAATLPKLCHLVFQSSDLTPPDDLLKIDGQDSFFQRVGQISPELISVALKMGRPTSWVRWDKASLTSEERRARPSFPRWVPTQRKATHLNLGG